MYLAPSQTCFTLFPSNLLMQSDDLYQNADTMKLVPSSHEIMSQVNLYTFSVTQPQTLSTK